MHAAILVALTASGPFRVGTITTRQEAQEQMVHTSRTEHVPAGWYQAPGESSLDRYWDGAAWTAEKRPRALAGLQPASPGLIDRDSGRHPLPWVFGALGLALLVAAPFVWGLQLRAAAALLGVGGCLLLSLAVSLLQLDLGPRPFAAINVAVGIAVLVAGVGAGLTVAPMAWVMVLSAVVLIATSSYRLLRRRRP